MANLVNFNPLTWVNKVTKRSATNFNRMEMGISDCANAVNTLNNNLTAQNHNLSGTPVAVKDLKIQAIQKAVTFTNGVGTITLDKDPLSQIVMCQALGYLVIVINTNINGNTLTISLSGVDGSKPNGDIWIRTVIIGR